MSSIQEDRRIATVPMFARVLAPTFTTLPSPYCPSSTDHFTTPWDGTDPLLGGHRGGHGDHPAATGPGGAV